MHKIKVFSTSLVCSIEEMEAKVNDFMKDKEVISVESSSSSMRGEYSPDKCVFVVIHYIEE